MRNLAIGLTVVIALASLSQQASTQRTRGRGARPPLNPLAAALDVDKDGAISAAELEEATIALKKLDRNRDGKLAGNEFVRPGGGARPGQAQSDRTAGESTLPENTPLAKTDAEKRILSVLDDLDKNERRGNMNVPFEDGRLLRILAETVNAKNVVEIGTSNGYSGIWFCLALRKTGGKLITHEIDARRAALARKNFKRAGVEGLITLVEGDAHKRAFLERLETRVL